MANLRANRITSTEVFETTGSVQFPPSITTALSVPAGSDFAYGTKPFTIECFIYAPTLAATPGAAYPEHIIFSQTIGGINYLMFGFNPSGQLFWVNTTSGGGTFKFSPVGSIQANTWQHVVACRDANNILRLFVDGVVVYSEFNTFDFNNTTYNPTIGNYTHIYIQLPFTGHISNFRVLKGTALYTENFTPSTRELEVIPNTVLLCAQSTTNAAEEKTGKTITVNGNAVANELTPGLLTNVVKSGGSSAITGSVEFDGTGDYLSLADSDDWYLDGDFTLECWFYPTSTPSNSNYGTIIGQWESGGGTDRNVLIYYYTDGSGNTSLYSNLQTSSTQLAGSFSISNANSFNNSWHHTALVVSDNQYMFFVDGIKISTSTVTGTTNNSTVKWMIGASDNGSGVGEYIFKGFISNARLIKGTALYTSDFIPPTRKLTKLPGTVLLCCTDSNDPTTEATGKTITANGDPTATRFTPSVGSDGSVEFAGPTTINTENYFYLPTGPTEQRAPVGNYNAGTRGVFAGGRPGEVNVIDYITISSTGNAQDFGDLTTGRTDASSFSSATRGVYAGGYGTPTLRNIIDYVTISSTGNAVDFGDTTQPEGFSGAGCSNGTRGVWAAGTIPETSNILEYVTIASTGNAQDFGDLLGGLSEGAACSSPTRGVFFSGNGNGNAINYITIASTGNAQDFGDCIRKQSRGRGGSSNTIKGVFGGGYDQPSTAGNVIEYINIATIGNSIDFGDLSYSSRLLGSAANSTRAVFSGGVNAFNNIEYVTISTNSNSIDFGDLFLGRHAANGLSNGHGGLG